MANPSTSQTNTDQSAANPCQEEVKQVQDQNSKDLKPETSRPSESMITEKLDVDKEQHVREMLVENPGEAQNLKDLKEVTSTSSEPMVTGQVDVKKEKHVPEMLSENPSAQNFKDLKVETSASSESMITEQLDVEKEENVEKMFVENPGATEDVAQVSSTHGQAEHITQLERDTGEPEVACVATEENELMETNQGNIENVVDELVAAVNDSTKLSEQGGNVECIDTTSESMETEQVTSKEDGVTQKATQVTTDESHNQASRGDLTEGEVVDNAVDSEISDSTVNCAGAASSDAVMLQVSVAMEIDTQGESSDANSPTEVELSESENPSKHLQEPEIALDREPNQALDSAHGETSVVMNVETLAECNTNESSVQDDTSSKDSEFYTTPATNT